MSQRATSSTNSQLTIKEAATYLNVSAASLRRWSDEGKLAVWRTPGGQRRFDRQALDDLMKESDDH